MTLLVSILSCWLMARNLIFLPCGHFHRLPVSLWHGTWLPPSKPFERERETPKWKFQSYKKLILEVACYHFCCILLVTWTNPGAMWKETILWGLSWKLALIPSMCYSIQKSTKQHGEHIFLDKFHG